MRPKLAALLRLAALIMRLSADQRIIVCLPNSPLNFAAQFNPMFYQANWFSNSETDFAPSPAFRNQISNLILPWRFAGAHETRNR